MALERSGFESGRAAREYLVEQLDRLERAVREASEVARAVTDLTSDALGQLETDPLAFRKVAAVHLRDLASEVTAAATTVAEREGLDREALLHVVRQALARTPAHGADVLDGLARGLRERLDRMGAVAQGATDDARRDLDQALAALDRGLDQVVRRWERAPAGFWTRRRRRKQLARQGLEHVAGLPDLTLGLAEAAREQRPQFEVAWAAMAEAAVSLGFARSLSRSLDALAAALAGLRRAGVLGAAIAADADRRLGRLVSGDRPAPGDRLDLVSTPLLDGALDALGITPGAFLGRPEVDLAALTRASRGLLESDVRAWVEGALADAPRPTLADALNRYGADGDAIRPLIELLAAGQPLLPFHDDLHRLFEGAELARYHVLVEATDDTLDDALREASLRLGLPAPEVERPDPAPAGLLALRVLQVASGIAWLSQAERLLPMARVHDEVLSGAEAMVGVPSVALRDTLESEELAPVLPERVRQALS